jgi:hypothetical protein
VPLNSAGGTPSTGATQVATQNPTVCNQAQMVSDVTVPDGTSMAAGSTFTKTWRLKNTGTCTWTNAYGLIFDHGERMDAPATMPLTAVNIPPGATGDVSVNLKAPSAAGSYQADFRLRSPDGVVFGIGSSGQGTFWVKIIVPGATGAPTAATPSTVPAVVSLLGKNISSSPEIVQFLATYTDGPCAETNAGSGILDCKSKTHETPFVRLAASNAADLVNSTINDVRIFPAFAGTLPENLTWNIARPAVEAKLGAPLAAPTDNGNGTIDAEYKTTGDAYKLVITFNSADGQMRRIRISPR